MSGASSAAPLWRALPGGGWHATVPDAAGMRAVGAALADVLGPGDLVVLDGPLGAGKTTLVQGLAAGLRVRGAVTSPTFVIARRHPGPRVALVHVDAYRIGTALEIEDLDLDADLADCVTVVEWGAGKVEDLADAHLEVSIGRAAGIPGGDDPEDPAAGPRQVVVRGRGDRWAGLQPPAG